MAGWPNRPRPSMIGLPDWHSKAAIICDSRTPSARRVMVEASAAARAAWRFKLSADAAEPLADFGRRAVASRRQQVQNGRPATQQFVLRRLALGQLG